MSTTVWTVAGMTCAHCAAAVTDSVSSLPGVSDVAVDLTAGRVRVTADPDPDSTAVASAVEEAGYALVTA